MCVRVKRFLPTYTFKPFHTSPRSTFHDVCVCVCVCTDFDVRIHMYNSYTQYLAWPFRRRSLIFALLCYIYDLLS